MGDCQSPVTAGAVTWLDEMLFSKQPPAQAGRTLIAVSADEVGGRALGPWEPMLHSAVGLGRRDHDWCVPGWYDVANRAGGAKCYRDRRSTDAIPQALARLGLSRVARVPLVVIHGVVRLGRTLVVHGARSQHDRFTPEEGKQGEQESGAALAKRANHHGPRSLGLGEGGVNVAGTTYRNSRDPWHTLPVHE